MAQTRSSIDNNGALQEKYSLAKTAWLILTVMPLIMGVLLIFAWTMNYVVMRDGSMQVFTGILLFLFGFMASNALQKHWGSASGWGLLLLAALLLMIWLHLWAQIAAMLVGTAGLGLLILEFYRQYRHVERRGSAR